MVLRLAAIDVLGIQKGSPRAPVRRIQPDTLVSTGSLDAQ
jgi:hypothetical protein